MIPVKDKKYGIACLGPYDYNRFGGVGIHTGEVGGSGGIEDPILYRFKLEDDDLCWFTAEEVICEAV